MTEKTATFIKTVDGWISDARLYRVNPPMPTDDGSTTERVIVSAVVVMFSGPETYILASDKNGENLNYSELDGSFRGGLDHEQALENAGYTVKS